MSGFNEGIEAEVSTEQARRFLECAVRNWGRVSFDREGLEDFRIELERFRQKVLADALKRPELSEAGKAESVNVLRLMAGEKREFDPVKAREQYPELSEAEKAYSRDQTCILRKGKNNDTVICGQSIAEQYLRQGYQFDWKATDEARARDRAALAAMGGE